MYTTILFILLLTLAPSPRASMEARISGWYLGGSLEGVPLELYSHVRADGPRLLANGTAVCDPSASFRSLQLAAKKTGTAVLWGGGGLSVHQLLFNTSETTAAYRRAFLSSIGAAMGACQVS